MALDRGDPLRCIDGIKAESPPNYALLSRNWRNRFLQLEALDEEFAELGKEFGTLLHGADYAKICLVAHAIGRALTFQPIAVTGLGAVTALGAGVESLWSGLLIGRCPFGPVRAFSADSCRVNLAAEVSARLPSEGSNRTVDLGLMAAREALADSRRTVTAKRIGLVVASTGMGDVALDRALGEPRRNPDWWRQCLKGTLADELAVILGLGDIRQVINTACSSGAIAVELACEGLRAGDYDMALALGCDELTRITYSGFNALRALDPGPCRPFDIARRGMTLGEGAGCLVLERLADARSQSKRIHAVVAGAGSACDAKHLTAPDPDGHGAAIAISKALDQANILASDVGFVNAHGTGTPLNDSAEISAIVRALGKHASSCKVHSVKACTGHCMGAAGTIEAIAAILSLQHGVVPATANLRNCEFEGQVDCVKLEPRAIEKGFGISNSFGFGGNDATLVLAHSDCLVC